MKLNINVKDNEGTLAKKQRIYKDAFGPKKDLIEDFDLASDDFDNFKEKYGDENIMGTMKAVAKEPAAKKVTKKVAKKVAKKVTKKAVVKKAATKAVVKEPAATKAVVKEPAATKAVVKATDDRNNKVIVKVAKENPRKKDTHGWRGWKLYKDGITVSEFKKAGGRGNDLRWDINKGFVILK